MLAPDPLERIYVAIDRAIGEILDGAREASVMVFSGHGMRHWYGAHFLLLDILVGLGVTARAPSTLLQFAERAAHAGWLALPNAVRQPLKLLLRRSAPAAGWALPAKQASAPILPSEVNAAASLCFPLSNGLAATGIRLNIEGREPAGRIAQGAPVRAFEDELIRALLEIIDERSGRPLIRTVLRTRELYGGAVLEALPDLLVEWSDDVATGSTVVGSGTGAVVRARSTRLGLVEGRNEYCRTGEHRVEGFVVATGSNIPHGILEHSISIMDLAPTMAAQLGVALHGIDGKVIDSLGGGAIRSDVVA
jgi:predicted AlkP superfamily phosphohydrolase/phosphomutase